jgi:hypothetical protein
MTLFLYLFIEIFVLNVRYLIQANFFIRQIDKVRKYISKINMRQEKIKEDLLALREKSGKKSGINAITDS